MKRCILFTFAAAFVAFFNCDTTYAASQSKTKTATTIKKKTSHKKSSSKSGTKKKNKITITAPKQSVVIDIDTKRVVSGENYEERCTPSSMTKVMTLYLTFEAIADGRLHLDDELPVSEKAKSQEGSRSFYEAGSLVKVEDLIRSIIVHSGNDACVVIAEKLAGDESAFANMMNEKAEQFGLKNTHFVNSTGLPDEEHYSTVLDIAVIALRIILDYPQYYHYFAEKNFTANGITQQNRNTLLGNSLDVDGLKTGHTSAGGFGIVISGKKMGKRLIAVVNGCPSAKARAVEANKLLAIAFNEYVLVRIATRDTPVATAAVDLGQQDKVNLYVNEDINVAIPKVFRSSLVVGINVKEPLPAPVIAGSKVGVLTYKYGEYTSREYDLFVRDAVAKLSFLESIIVKIKALFYPKKSKVDAPVIISTVPTPDAKPNALKDR